MAVAHAIGGETESHGMNVSHSGSQLSTSCLGAFQNPQGSSPTASHPISCSQYSLLAVWRNCCLSPVSSPASFCFHLRLAPHFQGCHSTGGTQQTQTSDHISSSLSFVPGVRHPTSAGLSLLSSVSPLSSALSKGLPAALSFLWQVSSHLYQLRRSIFDSAPPPRPVPFLMAPHTRKTGPGMWLTQW